MFLKKLSGIIAIELALLCYKHISTLINVYKFQPMKLQSLLPVKNRINFTATIGTYLLFTAAIKHKLYSRIECGRKNWSFA